MMKTSLAALAASSSAHSASTVLMSTTTPSTATTPGSAVGAAPVGSPNTSNSLLDVSDSNCEIKSEFYTREGVWRLVVNGEYARTPLNHQLNMTQQQQLQQQQHQQQQQQQQQYQHSLSVGGSGASSTIGMSTMGGGGGNVGGVGGSMVGSSAACNISSAGNSNSSSNDPVKIGIFKYSDSMLLNEYGGDAPLSEQLADEARAAARFRRAQRQTQRERLRRLQRRSSDVCRECFRQHRDELVEVDFDLAEDAESNEFNDENGDDDDVDHDNDDYDDDHNDEDEDDNDNDDDDDDDEEEAEGVNANAATTHAQNEEDDDDVIYTKCLRRRHRRSSSNNSNTSSNDASAVANDRARAASSSAKQRCAYCGKSFRRRHVKQRARTDSGAVVNDSGRRAASVSPQLDIILFNYGREIYSFEFQAVRPKNTSNSPIDKKLYKTFISTCFDLNKTASVANTYALQQQQQQQQLAIATTLTNNTKSPSNAQQQLQVTPASAYNSSTSSLSHSSTPQSASPAKQATNTSLTTNHIDLSASNLSLIVAAGFSKGEIHVYDVFRRDAYVFYNNTKLVDKSKVTCIKWLPNSLSLFLAGYSSGNIYLYDASIQMQSSVAPVFGRLCQNDSFAISVNSNASAAPSAATAPMAHAGDKQTQSSAQPNSVAKAASTTGGYSFGLLSSSSSSSSSAAASTTAASSNAAAASSSVNLSGNVSSGLGGSPNNGQQPLPRLILSHNSQSVQVAKNPLLRLTIGTSVSALTDSLSAGGHSGNSASSNASVGSQASLISSSSSATAASSSSASGASAFSAAAAALASSNSNVLCGVNGVNEFEFSPCGQYLAVVSQDGYLRVFTFVYRSNQQMHVQLRCSMKSYFGGLLCVCWSCDGKYIATGGEDDLITVFSFVEMRVVARGRGHSSWINCVAFDPWTRLGVPSPPPSIGNSGMGRSVPTAAGAAQRNDAALDADETTHQQQHYQQKVLRQPEINSSSNSSGSSKKACGPKTRTISTLSDFNAHGEYSNSQQGGGTTDSTVASFYRLASCGQDNQICFWDLTSDLLKEKQPNEKHSRSRLMSLASSQSHQQQQQPTTTRATTSAAMPQIIIQPSLLADLRLSESPAAAAAPVTVANTSLQNAHHHHSTAASLVSTARSLFSSASSKHLDKSSAAQPQQSSQTNGAVHFDLDTDSTGTTGSGSSSSKGASSFFKRHRRNTSNEIKSKHDSKTKAKDGSQQATQQPTPPPLQQQPQPQTSGKISMSTNGVLVGGASVSQQQDFVGTSMAFSGINSLSAGRSAAGGASSVFDVCPKLDEVAMIEPLICKRIATERLTSLVFKPDCFVVATQDGVVSTWARPPPKRRVSNKMPHKST